MLVLIGPRWAGGTSRGGYARIADPTDFVRLEIEAGLRGGLRVIPVLVGSARMPIAEELPPSLKALARRQAVMVATDGDMERLRSRLERIVGVR